MADTTLNGLNASVKALLDVVAPAVDPGNPLAAEQVRMVCGYLKLVGARLEFRHVRLRAELAHHQALAEDLLDAAHSVDAVVAGALTAAVARGRALAQQADASEAAQQDAAAALSAATSALVRASATASPALREAVERRVLRASTQWLDLQRAWFAPLGFDAAARALPPLPDLLRPPG